MLYDYFYGRGVKMPLLKRYSHVLKEEKQANVQLLEIRTQIPVLPTGAKHHLSDPQFSHRYNSTNNIRLIGCEVWMWCKQFVLCQRHLRHCGFLLSPLKVRQEAICRDLPPWIRMIPSLSLSSILRSPLLQENNTPNVLLRNTHMEGSPRKAACDFLPLENEGEGRACVLPCLLVVWIWQFSKWGTIQNSSCVRKKQTNETDDKSFL